MPPIEIPDTCEFDLGTDKLKLETQTNGDRVIMFPHLDANQAATLAWLANGENHVTVEIKLKEP